MSPSKTWEGFLGAIVTTTLFSFFFPLLLAKFSWFICPADYESLTFRPFQFNLDCSESLNPVFMPTVYQPSIFGFSFELELLPIQIHGLFYGLFASLVAPFGGFFASAIKRAYQIKDFDNLLPGHGGVMDRMDCQIFMIFFTAFHHSIWIASQTPSVTAMISMALTLSSADKCKLIESLNGTCASPAL